MKAVQIHRYGAPEELKYEDAPDPVIKEDEVLVKVYASGVNPIDWKVRKGYLKQWLPHSFPLILGWDLSGVVEQVGSNVKNFKKGDEVYGRPDPSRNGTYAEYIAVRASELAFKPTTLNHTEAAAVPLAGLTAWQGLMHEGELKPGQKVLINGASGGVGTYAVQFAKWKGAKVIATASKENFSFLKELGAEEIYDYHIPGYEKNIKDMDIVLDLAGGEEQKIVAGTLKKGGILVSTVGITDKDLLDEKGIKGKSFMAQSKPEDLKEIASLIDKEKVKPIISKVLPLQKADEAHRISENGKVRGKIVLEVFK
jgi:NADPH:quinone reductase-like Zn-dependent oxidoreductase